MPKALIEVPEVHANIVRPVAKQVLAHLTRKLNLPDTTLLMLSDDNGNIANEPVNVDPNVAHVHFPTETRINATFREVEGSPVPIYTPKGNKQHVPYFRDPIRDISVYVVRDMVKTEYDFEFTFPSRTAANQFNDIFKTLALNSEEQNMHTFDYTYLAPDTVTRLCMEVFNKIENSPEKGTYRSVKDYYDSWTLLETELQGRIDGKMPRRAIREIQHEIVGHFDVTTNMQRPTGLNDGTGAYTVSLTYTVYYSRPIQFYLEWPLLINNQLIGDPFLQREVYTTSLEIDLYTSHFKSAMDAIAYNRAKTPPYVTVPETDDWQRDVVDRRTSFFLQCLFTLEEDNSAVIDFRNLGDIALSPYAIEYLGHLGNEAFSRNSIFELELYENDEKITPKYYFHDGVFIFTNKLDYRKHHHIRLGINRNWAFVPEGVIEGLRRYPALTKEIFTFFNVIDGVEETTGWKLVGNGYKRLTDPYYLGEGYKPDGLGENNMVGGYVKVEDGSVKPITPEQHVYLHEHQKENLNRLGYHWIYPHIKWDDTKGTVTRKTMDEGARRLNRMINPIDGIFALTWFAHIIVKRKNE